MPNIIIDRPPNFERLEELGRWTDDQFGILQRALNQGLTDIQLVELNAEPVRPRNGMIVLADGTNWDPGSGAGFYGYRGGSWVLLG